MAWWRGARRVVGHGVLSILVCGISTQVASAATQPDAEYVVVAGDERVGLLQLRQQGGRVDLDLAMDDNGRGQQLQERIELGDDLIPRRWVIRGSGDTGSSVAEWFEQQGGRARWRALDGEGDTSVDRPMLYVPAESSQWSFGLFARAAARGQDGCVDTLPGGRLCARLVRNAEIHCAMGTVPVTVYRLQGLTLFPRLVLLDEADQLLAIIRPKTVFVDGRCAGDASRLAQLASEIERLELEQLGKRVTRQFDTPLYIRNARVFDAIAGQVTSPTTVVVYDGRIVSIRPDARPPVGAPVVDAAGGVVLPGLHDMHAHTSAWLGILHLAAGVTTIRDPGNHNADLLLLTRDLQAGRLPGPHTHRIGFIEGRSPFSERSTGVIVDSVERAIEQVRWHVDHGFSQIKLYNSFQPQWVEPVAAEVHRLGLRVSGHVPAFMTAEQAILAGYDEIHHVNQLVLGLVMQPGDDSRTTFRFTAIGERIGALDLSSEPVRHLVQLMKQRRVTLDPTLALFERKLVGRAARMAASDRDWLPHLPYAYQRGRRPTSLPIAESRLDDYARAYQRLGELIVLLDREGVRILPGTDDVAGFSLHSELASYVSAGMPAARALQLATIESARHLGVSERSGSIDIGKDADLLLLAGDPTADIGQLRRVRMVMRAGRIYFPSELYREMGIAPFAEPAVLSVFEGD